MKRRFNVGAFQKKAAVLKKQKIEQTAKMTELNGEITGIQKDLETKRAELTGLKAELKAKEEQYRRLDTKVNTNMLNF